MSSVSLVKVKTEAWVFRFGQVKPVSIHVWPTKAMAERWANEYTRLHREGQTKHYAMAR